MRKASRIILATLITGCSFAFTALRVSAQLPADQAPTPEMRLAFDAVSVKINRTGGASNINLGQAGGHVAIKNFNLLQIMGQAYGLTSLSQAVNTVIGLPGWGRSETFDIEAETKGSPTVQQKRLMLQMMLADRFGLAIHHETRELPIYVMVMVNLQKLGPQLRVHRRDKTCGDSVAPPANSQTPTATPANPPANSAPQSPAEMAAAALQHFPCGRVVGGLLSPSDHNDVWSGGRKVSMDMIAAGTGTMAYTDRPIVNRTGLLGDYDFTVEWDARGDDLSAGPQPESMGLSLFQAFHDQLGLKLNPEKGGVDVIVIDRVTQPTGN